MSCELMCRNRWVSGSFRMTLIRVIASPKLSKACGSQSGCYQNISVSEMDRGAMEEDGLVWSLSKYVPVGCAGTTGPIHGGLMLQHTLRGHMESTPWWVRAVLLAKNGPIQHCAGGVKLNTYKMNDETLWYLVLVERFCFSLCLSKERENVTWCLWCTTASLGLSLSCPIIENDRRERPAKALTLFSDNHLPIHDWRDRWEETTSELQLTDVPPQNALFILTCFYHCWKRHCV